MRFPNSIAVIFAALLSTTLLLRAQTTALDAWQADQAGDNLDQLDGFQRSGGSAANGGIISGATSPDVLLSLTADQTLFSKATLAVPASTAAIPFVAVHGRVTLYGTSGAAGVGIADSSAASTWYYLLLNGAQVILRRSNAGTESNVASWSFSPGSSAAELRLIANYSTPGQIVFTVRYGLVGSAVTTQTATDAAPLSFASGRLRTVVHTRSGRLADFALATRILEPVAEPSAIAFPAAANVINVKSAPYNAAGDGVTDDTAAIQAAITAAVGSAQGMRTLYFPDGTYLVSKRLEWKNASAQWENYLTLQGQSRAGTVIKLKNSANSGADNFTNAAAPRAVIFTASELNTSSPTSGGKDYTNLGEGNAAFGNSIFNLTIDTGTGNPGAIAVDFLTNNSGTLRSVTLKSSDGQGVAGLGLIRKWTGPLLVKDVLIDGFVTGILTQNTNYSAVLEHVTLRNQTAYGIDNQAGIVLAIRGLLFRSSSASAIAIRNNGQGGLVTLLDSTFLGANPTAAAIDNNSGSGATADYAALYARNVITDGFATALRHNAAAITGTVTDEYVSGGARAKFPGSAFSSLHLPVEETPVFFESNLTQWVNVQDFGANPEDSADDASAIQAAIDSTATGQANAGKTILYFPQGLNATSRYLVGSTVVLRHAIRKIEGNFARLSATGNFFEDWNFTNPIFRVSTGTTTDPLFIERLEFRAENLTVTPLSIEHDTARTLVVRHTDLNGLRTTYNAGKLFIEDVTAHTLTSLFRLEGPSPVYARQLNPEDLYNTKVRVIGTSLWCLGLKTERPGPVLLAAGGARVEVLGGLFHNAVHPSPSGLPAVIAENSAVTVSAATVGSGALRYDIDARETRASVTLDQTVADSPDRPAYSSSSSLLPLFSAWDGLGALSLPAVSVTATVPYAAEPATAGQFTFTRSGDTSAALTVNYTVSGSATNGVDYTTLSGTATIPAGSRTVTVAVTPIDDTIAEYPERVTLSISTASTYNPGWPSQATVAISDNDVVTGTPPSTGLVMWLRADAGVVADPSGGLLAWRDQSGNGNHAINDEALRRPLWQSGVADQFVSQPQVTFQNRGFLLLQPSATLQRAAAGYSAKTHAVYFRTGPDITTRQVLWEQGSNGRGLNLYLDGGNIYAGAWNAPTAGGWKVFRSTPVAANTEYLAILVFDAATSAVTAYLGTTAFSGTTTASGTVAALPTQGDESTLGGMISSTLFHDGSSVLSGYYFSGAIAEVFAWNTALDSTARADLQTYITGKYSPSLVFASLAATVPSASESPYAEGSFTVTRTGSTANSLTLHYTVGGTAANGSDYQSLPGTITLAPGVSSAPILVRPIADSAAEFDETVTLTLQSGPGYSLTGATTGTVTLRQDVVLPLAITRSVSPGSIITVPVTLANPSPTSATTFTLDIPVNYTAVRSDSTAINRPSITWQEIATNGKGTVVFDYNNARVGLDHDTPSAAIPLGFTFPYYGTNFTSLRLSVDGWASFTATAAAPDHLDLATPNLSAPAALLAPFWKSMSVNNVLGKVVYHKPDAQTFVAHWYKTTATGIGGPPGFQLILKADGTIYYNYNIPSTTTGDPSCIGLQSPDRTRSLGLRYESSYNADYVIRLPLTVRLDPPQTWLSASATTVVVPAGGSATFDLTLDATALAQGDTRSFTVALATNFPGAPTLSLPVTLVAENTVSPSITSSPTDQFVVTGGTASFSVAATGTAPLAFQWQLSTDSGASWVDIATATSASYTTFPLGLADSGRRFRCIVGNSAGSIASAAASLTVTLPSATSARVVSWDGDYVTTNQLLQGPQSTANGDWNADTIALDQRRWIPFSLVADRQPAAGYTATPGHNATFHGGVLVERYGSSGGAQQNVGTLASGTIGVLNSTTDDRIRIGSDTTGEWCWGVVLFGRSDFLAGGAFDDICSLDANSRFTLTVPSARNAQARFVVISKGVTYVSAPFGASQTSVAPTSLAWFVWTFAEGDAASAISSLKIANPPAALFPDFSDVEAVGYTVQAFPVADPATDRSSFNVSAFTADMTVSPGPANFADWTVFSHLPADARAASADPDGDGVCNLLEYALGGNPSSAASAPVPNAQYIQSNLQLSFIRARADLNYVIQGSSDLSNWTDLATNPGAVNFFVPVTFTDTVNLDSASPLRRFLRLKVIAP